MITHIHSGGMVGGYSVCDNKGNQGKLVDDADKSDCVDCITLVRDYFKKNPNPRYEAEIKRACTNIGLEF